MRPVLLNGFYTGRYEFLNYSGTSSVPISSFDSNLYAVIGLNNNKSGYNFYFPNNSTNELTHFISGENYIVFTRKTFTVSVTGEPISRLDIKSNALSGQYTFAYYPFTKSLPFSAYNQHLLEIQSTNKVFSNKRFSEEQNVLINRSINRSKSIQLIGFPNGINNSNPNVLITRTSILNGKNEYIAGLPANNFPNSPGGNVRVFWDGTRWALEHEAFFYSDGSEIRYFYALGDTEYPWQAAWTTGPGGFGLLTGAEIVPVETTTLSSLTASIDGAVFLSYQPNRLINAETHFKQGQTYIIKASSNFIVYNPDVSSLIQENGSYLFLENNDKDRLVVE